MGTMSLSISIALVLIMQLPTLPHGIHIVGPVPLPAIHLAPVADPPPYAEGLYCSPRGVVNGDGSTVDASHPCHCDRMDYAADCDGPPSHPSKACTQYCTTAKCHCPATCIPVPEVGASHGR